MTRLRQLLIVGGVCLLSLAGRALAAPSLQEQAAFFDEKVKPLLVSHCVKCHGGEKVKGGLKLTNREAILKGGESGPAVVLDAPAKSKLLDAINYRNELEMPPKQKLPQADIDVLTKWVEQGLIWPQGVDLGPKGGLAVEDTGHKPPPKPSEARSFWSFQPVKKPAVPSVKNAAWVRNPVDAFIAAKLEEKNFHPAPPADRAALLRRAYFDLIGLPPTPADVAAFVADKSPDAYEKVIDKLLASPQYGEKWGRYWLDLVRFAETNSYERDNPKPNAWRYRDYVIRSFNADKPYSEFLKEQLAGDEMPDVDSNPDRIIATGFYRLGIWDDEPSDRETARYDGLDDIVTTVGQGMLGLTLDCARCHDHKIDPIPQADYYKLVAFFHNIADFQNGGGNDQRPIVNSKAEQEAYILRVKERKSQLVTVESLIEETHSNFFQLLTGQAEFKNAKRSEANALINRHGERVLGAERFAEYKRLKKQAAELSKPEREQEMALCVTEKGSSAPETNILVRGMAAVKGPAVKPGFPEVIGTPDPELPKPASNAKTTGRRTVLANWIASKENPLTARVMANRVWQFHFGRGIVRSSNNFGLQGDKPTHPELLDWLADQLVSNGWKLKPLHKTLMLSNAYQMASHGGDAKALAADPRNDLYWRFDLRRLTSEEIRDSILSVNGTLNPKMYGPSIYPFIPKEVMAGQSRPGHGWNLSTPDEAARRSIYIHVKRSLRVPIIESFDGAETDRTCPIRFATVQPTQALGMLNGSFANEEAAKFAARLKKEAGDDVKNQVTLALKLVTSRAPNAKEVQRGLDLINDLKTKDMVSPELAMKYFCLMALNLNEFVFVD